MSTPPAPDSVSEAIVITPPDTSALATQANALVERANALVIQNAVDHEAALRTLVDYTSFEKTITALFEPTKTAAHRAHKNICDLEGKFLRPIADAKRIYNRKLCDYEVEAERKAEEERRRIQKELDAKEQERILNEAVAAEEDGAQDVAEALLSQPSSAPAVHVQAAVAKVEGVSKARDVYHAEVTDRKAALTFILANWDTHGKYAELSMTELNKLARAAGEAFRFPGVAAVPERVRSVRTK